MDSFDIGNLGDCLCKNAKRGHDLKMISRTASGWRPDDSDRTSKSQIPSRRRATERPTYKRIQKLFLFPVLSTFFFWNRTTGSPSIDPGSTLRYSQYAIFPPGFHFSFTCTKHTERMSDSKCSKVRYREFCTHGKGSFQPKPSENPNARIDRANSRRGKEAHL